MCHSMCHVIDLIQYNDLPEWYQDNNLITEGYRAPNPNYNELINSIFSLHNETANIWSHIAGVVLFIVLAIYYGTSDLMPIYRLLIIGYCVLVIFAFSLSIVYHTCNCHSQEINYKCITLDYLGIIFLIFGKSCLLIYVIFYQNINMRIIYCAISGLLLLVLYISTQQPDFYSSNSRPYRVLLYGMNCLYILIPLIHGGIESCDKKYIIILTSFLIMVGFYLIGIIFYVKRFPENICQNKIINYIGHSHNWWHLFTILGALTHLIGMVQVIRLIE